MNRAMTSIRPLVVYRLVRTDPPEERDLLSQAALGRRLSDPRLQDLSEGLSVFISEEEARAQALRAPHLGRYIAEIRLPVSVRIEHTGTRGHHTVWADPAVLLRGVIRVVPAVRVERWR